MRVISRALEELIVEVNAFGRRSQLPTRSTSTSTTHPLISFHKKGRHPRRAKPSEEAKKLGWIWGSANDWVSAFHLREYGASERDTYTFPPDVCVTSSMPDGYLISRASRRVVVIELTSPYCDKMAEWNAKKTEKYTDTIVRPAKINGWNVFLLTLEVSARGFVPTSFTNGFRALGLPRKRLARLVGDVTHQAQVASFIIFINRFNRNFRPWGLDAPPPKEDSQNV